jgi:hypothetical protein
MPTPADRQNEDDQPPLRPMEKFHHAPSTPKRHVPSNTFKKEYNDDDVVARTSPRVSPGTRRGWKRGTPEALQEGMVAPAGVTASVLNKPTGISPDPQKITTSDDPECSAQLAAHKHAPPRSWCHPRRLTVVTNTRPRERKMGQQEQGQQHRSRAGGNRLHRVSSRQPIGRSNRSIPGPN